MASDCYFANLRANWNWLQSMVYWEEGGQWKIMEQFQNMGRWKFYHLQTSLYLIPKINVFLAFAKQLVLTMGLWS